MEVNEIRCAREKELELESKMKGRTNIRMNSRCEKFFYELRFGRAQIPIKYKLYQVYSAAVNGIFSMHMNGLKEHTPFG